MTNYKIKKAKIVKDLWLEVQYDEIVTDEDENTHTNEVNKLCRERVHDDLKLAMHNLTKHLAILCKYYPAIDLQSVDEVINEPRLTPFYINGFSIGGEGEHEGVTLIGGRQADHNRKINLNSPFVKFEDEHCPYDLAHELHIDVLYAIDEVKAFLEGKHAPNPQLKLEL